MTNFTSLPFFKLLIPYGPALRHIYLFFGQQGKWQTGCLCRWHRTSVVRILNRHKYSASSPFVGGKQAKGLSCLCDGFISFGGGIKILTLHLLNSSVLGIDSTLCKAQVKGHFGALFCGRSETRSSVYIMTCIFLLQQYIRDFKIKINADRRFLPYFTRCRPLLQVLNCEEEENVHPCLSEELLHFGSLSHSSLNVPPTNITVGVHFLCVPLGV